MSPVAYNTPVERLPIGKAINLRPDQLVWHDHWVWTVLGVDMRGSLDYAIVAIRLQRRNHRGSPIHKTITREGRLP